MKGTASRRKRAAHARLLAALIALAALRPAAGPLLAQGDDTVVEARVDATRIGEADSVTLTIEVRGSNPGPVEDPDLSGLADFTIATGPAVSTSTRMIWSGGRASSMTSKQFAYTLFPRRKGALTVPTISVRLGSRVRQTDPIGVEVVEGSIRQRPPALGRRAGPGLGGAQAPASASGEILVEAQADRKEAYVGEQILLTYKVYTQLQLSEVPAPQRLPSYTGFWVEEFPVDPRASIHRVSRGGKEFLELTLMKKAIFPTTSGELTIEATTFSMRIRVETQDPFDSIFFTPTRTLERKTAPIVIRAKPLPEQGRPAAFNGAVGRYTIAVQADRREARVNDAVGLKVAVKGTGNIRTVGEPLLPPLPDYKKYAPRVEETEEFRQDRLMGSKTWDYVLTPLAPGHQDIPPIRFAYFDPSRDRYVETSSQAIPVTVLRSEPAPDAGGGAPAASRREVTAFGRDIRYIKPSSELGAARAPFHRSAAFAALLAGPALINAGLLLLVRRRERMQSQAGLVRGRRAPAFARRRLKQARRVLVAERSRAFHQEVARALAGYVGDKLDMSPAGLTHEEIDRLLQERGVSAAPRAELRRCLEACDYARFAPVAPGLAEMRELLGRAERTIATLEEQLGARRREAVA